MQLGAKPERSFSTCSSSCLGTWEGRQVLGKPRLDQISGLRSGFLWRWARTCRGSSNNAFFPLLTTLLTLDAR